MDRSVGIRESPCCIPDVKPFWGHIIELHASDSIIINGSDRVERY